MNNNNDKKIQDQEVLQQYVDLINRILTRHALENGDNESFEEVGISDIPIQE